MARNHLYSLIDVGWWTDSAYPGPFDVEDVTLSSDRRSPIFFLTRKMLTVGISGVLPLRAEGRRH